MQQSYWKTMVQIKSSIFYLDLYADKSYKLDKAINIVLAITSSSSIAAWAIWKQYDFVWALLIALSQVITVLKPLMPYKQRLEIVKPYSMSLQSLFDRANYHWFFVSNGDMTEAEINDLNNELREKFTAFSFQYLQKENLPENDEFKKIADKKTVLYFSETF